MFVLTIDMLQKCDADIRVDGDVQVSHMYGSWIVGAQ